MHGQHGCGDQHGVSHGFLFFKPVEGRNSKIKKDEVDECATQGQINKIV